MKIAITGELPTAAQFQTAAAQLAAAKAADGCEAFAEAYYKAATGKDVDFPSMAEVLQARFKERSGAYDLLAAPTGEYSKMFVADYYGGYALREDFNKAYRVVEARAQDALPGDVLYVLPTASNPGSAEAWVFDGSFYRSLADGKLRFKTATEVSKLLSYDIFVLLRASQMG